MHPTLETPAQRIERLARERGIPIVRLADVQADVAAREKTASVERIKRHTSMEERSRTAALNRLGRPVVNDAGEWFSGVTKAALAYGVTKGSITCALTQGSRCKGLRWSYADTSGQRAA